MKVVLVAAGVVVAVVSTVSAVHNFDTDPVGAWGSVMAGVGALLLFWGVSHDPGFRLFFTQLAEGAPSKTVRADRARVHKQLAGRLPHLPEDRPAMAAMAARLIAARTSWVSNVGFSLLIAGGALTMRPGRFGPVFQVLSGLVLVAYWVGVVAVHRQRRRAEAFLSSLPAGSRTDRPYDGNPVPAGSPSPYLLQVARRRRSVRVFYALVGLMLVGFGVASVIEGDPLPWPAVVTTVVWLGAGAYHGWYVPKQVDDWTATQASQSEPRG